MTGPIRRIGRPLGVVSMSALRLASSREVTVFDVARELQLSRRDASVTLYELRARGHVQEVGRQLVAGARKPVPVVRASTTEPAPDVPGILALTWPLRP